MVSLMFKCCLLGVEVLMLYASAKKDATGIAAQHEGFSKYVLLHINLRGEKKQAPEGEMICVYLL